jgi:hypothetical protein
VTRRAWPISQDHKRPTKHGVEPKRELEIEFWGVVFLEKIESISRTRRISIAAPGSCKRRCTLRCSTLWIDVGGSPMSEAAVMTERIRRPNYGALELEITINDPKTYTRPWTVKMVQKIELDTELIDEMCLENEKSYERLQAVRPKK